MKYLLDTNICITILKAGNQKVINRFLIEQPYNLSVCSIVKAELFYGACKSHNTREFERVSGLHLEDWEG